MFFLLGLLVGIIFPAQTAVNSKLRSRVGSPYLAAMVAFIMATVFLGILTLCEGQSLGVPLVLFRTQPAWLWLGGVFGIIGGTIPIILFPHLGSVQTVVIPLVGQILMGMLIDNFGWFRSPVYHFNGFRLLGIVILLVGLMLVTGLFKKHQAANTDHHQLWWQTLGLLAGFALASQAAINGQLGALLKSPVHSAFISFLTGMIILIIGVSCFERDLNHLKFAWGHGNPWWIWFGGLLGGSYVFGNSFLVPLIGTGATVVITLLGNIAGGLGIDQFGWLGAQKKPIQIYQSIGLLLMILGVSLVKFF